MDPADVRQPWFRRSVFHSANTDKLREVRRRIDESGFDIRLEWTVA